MTEEIKDIKEALEQLKPKEKEKKFRLPFGKKVSGQQRRKNYVTIIKLNENNGLDFLKLPIENQTILIDKIPRLAEAGYVFYWKKNPFIILPSWSVKPISARGLALKSLGEGSNIAGYEILLARMESESTAPKGKVSGLLKWIFGLGLLSIIIYAFVTGGG